MADKSFVAKFSSSQSSFSANFNQGGGGGGTEVIANPTLIGTEEDLTGLQVGETKYKVPSGESAVSVTGTLQAGQTSITLENAAITTNGTFDFYTNAYGVNPTSATVASGSITLTFEAQQADLGVKVVIR